MPRLLSVALTLPAVEARQKTETRRLGWWNAASGTPRVRPGDRLTLCRKVMGRRKGEPLERVVDVRLTAVRREPLHRITDTGVDAEGFGPWQTDSGVRSDGMDWWPPGTVPPTDHHGAASCRFVEFFTTHMGCTPLTLVTVLSWEYLPDRVGWPDDQGVLL